MDKNNENMQAVNNQRPLLENDEYYKEITELCSGATEPKFYPEFGDEIWKCTCGHTNDAKSECCQKCGVSCDKLRLFFSELFLLQKRRENEVRRKALEKKRMEDDAEKWRQIDPEVEHIYSEAQSFEPTRDNYLAAAKKLDSIKGYKDSEALAAKYRELAEDAPLYDKKTLAQMRIEKIKKAINVSLIAAGALLVIYIILYFTVIAPGGMRYKIVDGEVTITSYNQFFGGKNVVIPEKIMGKKVTAIGDYAFEECTAVLSVKIPDTVKKIGNGAFRNCDSLKKIVIPASVTELGSTSFSYCDLLTDAELYSQATKIPMTMFRDCPKLSRVIIDMPLEIIDSSAFYKCTEIKVVRYTGTREEWEKISIQGGNESLTQAAVQYDYEP
ncbi:MAG: leucine-rich repeat domain-containing protein [Clostridia bacterium]|nr:leucine-rich repeat domain-containing protein [Clostridia bacterium]